MKIIEKEKCPCEECLTKAMCRNRTYSDLIRMCRQLHDFLYVAELGDRRSHEQIGIHRRRVTKFEKVLKPTGWKLGYLTKDGGGYFVVEVDIL